MRSRPRHELWPLLVLPSLILPGVPASAKTAVPPARADVVVIVDTSISMREPGMDPERTSLLVTQLLSDLVPGDLAAVRLLDLVDDAALLPRKETGATQPCVDDPSQNCGVVEPASDWEADARRRGFGVLRRPARGDAAFKKALEQHLEQRSHNSPFYLAFRAAQGVLEGHRSWNSDLPRIVIWLSDGRPENEELTLRAIRELTADGVDVQAVVFGAGDPRVADTAGIPVRRSRGPAELMQTFADIFRRIVQAPYELDNRVASAPRFEMKAHVDEAWVVVYGDDTLGEVSLTGPDGPHTTSFAADRRPGAGAYRVAHLERPAAGEWTVHVQGGGPEAAYAVVQRSSLAPVLIAPERAWVGAPTPLVVGVASGDGGDLLTDPEVLARLRMTASVEGRTVPLADDGTGGDRKAGDGRFTASVQFGKAGRIPVLLSLAGELVNRRVRASVEVAGSFRLKHPPGVLDLGSSSAGQTVCRELHLEAVQVGRVPFTLRLLRQPPSGHSLRVRLPAGELGPGSPPVLAAAGDRFEVCLSTDRRAPSSGARGETWIELEAAGGSAEQAQVPVALRWRVSGLSWWQRWSWLVLTIAACLLLAFLVLGFVLPQRFQRSLALSLAVERGELEEQSPQPIRQWPGVGIGFYRSARAFLHADYRISGNRSGALATLHAEKGGTRVSPGGAATLARETLDGDWEPVGGDGRRARGGDVYRIADSGPYFRISLRGGAR